LARFVEAKETVDPIIDLASKKDHKRELSQVYSINGAFYSFIEEDQEGLEGVTG
jgi:hypothetical protein